MEDAEESSGDFFFAHAFDGLLPIITEELHRTGVSGLSLKTSETLGEFASADFLAGGDFAFDHLPLGHALDASDQHAVGRSDERERESLLADPAGAADAVNVVVQFAWQRIVHDMADVVDIQSAASHVGGDEDFEFSVTEGFHGLLSSGLVHVTVEAVHGIAAAAQISGEVIDQGLGLTEHDAVEVLGGVDQLTEHLRFVALVGEEVNLLDVFGEHLSAIDLNLAGIGEEPVCDLAHVRTHRCGKQPDAALSGRDLAQNRFEVVFESHGDHLIGFIQNNGLNSLKRKRSALQVI